MKKMATESKVVEELVSNINNKNIKTSTNINKKNVSTNGKMLCKAARKLPTYGEAYQLVQDNKDVYLVKENVKGVEKTFAYIRCIKSSSEGCDFCNIHQRVNKISKDKLKVFETDVLPKTGSTDKNRWLASLKDEYFDNMRKKKETVSDAVSVIVKNKNTLIYEMLNNYATELLKKIDIKEPSSKKKNAKKQKETNKKTSINIDTNTKSNNTIETTDESNETTVDIIDDESVSDNEEEVNFSDSNEKDEDEDNEEELEMDDTFVSNDGQEFYLKDDIAYKNNNDGEVKEFGILKEVLKKYHTVEYNNKYYSIFHHDKHDRKGEIYICLFTYRIFNKKMNLIGHAEKKVVSIGNEEKIIENTFKMIFDDEI